MIAKVRSGRRPRRWGIRSLVRRRNGIALLGVIAGLGLAGLYYAQTSGVIQSISPTAVAHRTWSDAPHLMVVLGLGGVLGMCLGIGVARLTGAIDQGDGAHQYRDWTSGRHFGYGYDGGECGYYAGRGGYYRGGYRSAAPGRCTKPRAQRGNGNTTLLELRVLAKCPQLARGRGCHGVTVSWAANRDC